MFFLAHKFLWQNLEGFMPNNNEDYQLPSNQWRLYQVLYIQHSTFLSQLRKKKVFFTFEITEAQKVCTTCPHSSTVNQECVKCSPCCHCDIFI